MNSIFLHLRYIYGRLIFIQWLFVEYISPASIRSVFHIYFYKSPALASLFRYFIKCTHNFFPQFPKKYLGKRNCEANYGSPDILIYYSSFLVNFASYILFQNVILCNQWWTYINLEHIIYTSYYVFLTKYLFIIPLPMPQTVPFIFYFFSSVELLCHISLLWLIPIMFNLHLCRWQFWSLQRNTPFSWQRESHAVLKPASNVAISRASSIVRA
jgi:hypothetical protein